MGVGTPPIRRQRKDQMFVRVAHRQYHLEAILR